MNSFGDVNWLVSCRSVSEARLAARHGVPIIDFKEPSRGALEATDASVWSQAIADLAEGRPGCCLSAALGESPRSMHKAADLPAGFRFAKAGPSGLATLDAIHDHWSVVAERLPHGTTLVAVAYADHVSAGCPSVESILGLAASVGLKHVLVDTFQKNGQSLTDHHPNDAIRDWIEVAAASGLWISLAGSLRLQQCQRLVDDAVVPHCWGARGDVCVPSHTGRRTGDLDPDRLRLWADFIADAASTRLAPSSLQSC